jgi:ferredoxin
MIFYFSGTGNSLWVAKELCKAFNEPLVSIAEVMKGGNHEIIYSLQPAEKVFIIYPVHSWGPAVLVSRFISRLKLKEYAGQAVYSVCTCGDECGYTENKIKRWLGRKGITLSGSYSLQMPNNYILLPGFDVDSQEVEKRKVREASGRLAAIVHAVREATGEKLYQTGSLPFLKSRIVYPLFVRYALRQIFFYATEACIYCGICVKSCPTGTITMEKGKSPKWKKDTCVQCLACIHHCPERAIEYGNISKKKGRYHHPE